MNSGRRSPAGRDSSPRSITRRSASGTSSRHSCFLALGGLEALVMRLQLAGPNLSLLTPSEYNQLFSTHGMTMIFLVRVADSVWLLELLVAAAPRQPRHGLSTAQCPLLLGLSGGGHSPVCRISHGQRPERRLVQLRPVRGTRLQPGVEPGLLFARHDPARHLDHRRRGEFHRDRISHAGAGDVHQPGADHDLGHADCECRKPHRGAGRESGFLLALDGPATSGRISIEPAGGGQVLLWQHLFWIYGHPWVYAIVLPAMGMVSDGLPGLLPPPPRRLRTRCLRHRGDHDSRLRRLGASHVCDRAPRTRHVVFLRAPRSSSCCPPPSPCSPGSPPSGTAARCTELLFCSSRP